MRLILAFLIVLLLAGKGHSGEDVAPSGEAAYSATRNLLRALGTEDAADHRDALPRYVDSAEFLSRVVQGCPVKPSAAEQEELRGSLLEVLVVGPLARKRRPENIDSVSFRSRKLPGGLREVRYRIKSETIILVWASGDPTPMLVDCGYAMSGLLSVLVAARSKEKSQSPAAIVAQLLEAATKADDQAAITKSKDNIKTLLALILSRAPEVGYPRFNGKNFVLSVVANDQLAHKSNPQNLSVLFSPGDKERSLANVNVAHYEKVTAASLKEGTDFDSLTSYAGRRNRDRSHLIMPTDLVRGTPLIADLSFPEIALVGFSDGAVKTLTRSQLGLGPLDPIVAGDNSVSPILRVLSSR